MKKKTPQKDCSYKNHTLLKRISSDEKTALPVSPQKLKSTKEKRDSFKLDKEKFYSKRPDKNTVLKTSDESDIHMVEDNEWMSVSKQKNTKETKKDDKTVRRRRSKEFARVDNSLEGKIREAKNRMAERGMQQAVQPKPIKRKHSSGEGI